MEGLGRGALILAFVLAVYAAGAGIAAGRRRDRRTLLSAANAVYGTFAAVLVADAAFLTAIVQHDFSYTVVWQTTSRDLPLGYLLSSFWGSQAGSLLLWLTILSGAAAIVVRSSRRGARHGELMPWVIAILGSATAFFTTVLIFAASPFVRQIAPPNGNGLDPALQNPYMIAHPPALYLGYVCMAVPFAFAMAALISGRTDARWIVATRRWTLSAWSFLAIGMLLGAHWAYVEVGWGGYWAWDPVENAALMPWLTASAFLHSVMVQEKKGMLKVWNMALVSATFALCIFGTFLTRSGILESIHAFAVSDIGWWFVGYIAVIIGGATALIVWRLPLLRTEHRMESLVSREATFLFNNLLFVGICFAVLWGVLYPLVSETVTGQRATVSAPFYIFFVVAFGLPLIALMGIGPLLAWRRASLRSLRRPFLWPAVAGVAVALLLALLGYGTSPPGVAAISLSAFVAVAITMEFGRGVSARRALTSEGRVRALGQLIARNRRRYGGYIVHLAVVVLVIGVAGSSAYSTTHTATLNTGESVRVRGYDLTFRALEQERGANYVQTSAVVDVTRNGKRVATLRPARRAFTIEQRSTNEVAIRTDLRNGEDLFLILDGVGASSIQLKTLVNPLVNLIWVAGIIFLLGAVVAGWPDRREARMLARRYAEEPVPGEA